MDISDILRKELTLKVPINIGGGVSAYWEQKILSVERSVALHIRHGDYIYNPIHKRRFITLPLEYYYDCINILNQQYKDFTVFVFSNNLNWAKENIKLDVPTEFVEGCERDIDELYLMSLCKNNIIANSTFSWWSAWLNKNNDKKVFRPKYYIYQHLNNVDSKEYELKIKNEDNQLSTSKWVYVPFNLNKPLNLRIKPMFSILLVIDDDFSTINDCIYSILSQDYEFYEVIIIDNASLDGSGEFCQQAVKDKNNVIFIKLYNKIKNHAAWNMALNIARGNYILFFTGTDRILKNALSSIYLINEPNAADVVNSISWINEDNDGKLIVKIDSSFQFFKGTLRIAIDDFDILAIIINKKLNPFLANKIFKREFLVNNDIKFKEKIENLELAKVLFLIETFSQTKNYIFTSQIFYVEPKK